MLRRFVLSLLAGLLLFAAAPGQAAVTIVFWSHDMDSSFPHAFFELRGTPDGGGPTLDENYGYTADAVTWRILLGSTKGKIENASLDYLKRSDARFSLVLTDQQLAAVQTLMKEWSVKRYRLNSNNCVHFIGEVARAAGLTVPTMPKLMKKPRQYLTGVMTANPGKVTVLDMEGPDVLRSRGIDPATVKKVKRKKNDPLAAPEDSVVAGENVKKKQD